jgi:tetratricopeptide (TPR) repeat protein
MSLKISAVALAIALLAALGPAARGQPVNDGEACLQGSGQAVLDEAFCRRALSRQGRDRVERAALRTARARALANLGETPAALTEIARALALNPGAASAYLLRAQLSGDPRAAVADLNRAVALNPYFVDALAFRGAAHLQTGDINSALADFDRALAIRPRSSLALFYKAVARFKQGRFEPAAQLFRAVLTQTLVRHPIAALWLAAAAGRRGADATATLQPFSWWWEDGVWPSPLVHLWSGAAGPDATAAAILRQTGGRRAQGAFFLGQWYLAQGNPVAAREWLDRTRRHGGPQMMEVIVAGPAESD